MGCLNPVLLSWCSCLLTRRMDSSKGSVLSSLHVLKMLELLQSLNGQKDIAGRIIKEPPILDLEEDAARLWSFTADSCYSIFLIELLVLHLFLSLSLPVGITRSRFISYVSAAFHLNCWCVI